MTIAIRKIYEILYQAKLTITKRERGIHMYVKSSFILNIASNRIWTDMIRTNRFQAKVSDRQVSDKWVLDEQVVPDSKYTIFICTVYQGHIKLIIRFASSQKINCARVQGKQTQTNHIYNFCCNMYSLYVFNYIMYEYSKGVKKNKNINEFLSISQITHRCWPNVGNGRQGRRRHYVDLSSGSTLDHRPNGRQGWRWHYDVGPTLDRSWQICVGDDGPTLRNRRWPDGCEVVGPTLCFYGQNMLKSCMQGNAKQIIN